MALISVSLFKLRCGSDQEDSDLRIYIDKKIDSRAGQVNGSTVISGRLTVSPSQPLEQRKEFVLIYSLFERKKKLVPTGLEPAPSDIDSDMQP